MRHGRPRSWQPLLRYRRRLRAPPPAVLLEQHIRFSGSPRSGLVSGQARRRRLPRLEDWLDRLPAGFDDVHAMEERLIAGHRVEEERLVPGARFDLEMLCVAEIHRDGFELFERPGNLGVERE